MAILSTRQANDGITSCLVELWLKGDPPQSSLKNTWPKRDVPGDKPQEVHQGILPQGDDSPEVLPSGETPLRLSPSPIWLHGSLAGAPGIRMVETWDGDEFRSRGVAAYPGI